MIHFLTVPWHVRNYRIISTLSSCGEHQETLAVVSLEQFELITFFPVFTAPHSCEWHFWGVTKIFFMKMWILGYFSVIVFLPRFRTRKGCQTRYYFGFYDLESYVSQEGSFHKIVLSCPLTKQFRRRGQIKINFKSGVQVCYSSFIVNYKRG